MVSEVPLTEDDLAGAALSHWSMLAKTCGLSADLPASEVLLARKEAHGPKVVLVVRQGDGKPMLLKQEVRQDNHPGGHFALCLAAQEQARRRLAGNMQGLRVPRLLAFLPKEAVALLEYLPGENAATLLEQSDSNRDRRAILQDCGRWLAEFHRSARGPHRPYQTRYACEHLQKVRSDVNIGKLKVADTAIFISLVDAVLESAVRFDGLPAQHAERHGDYNLRNIVIERVGGASKVGAFDFRPSQSAPVGYDVARLLVDFTALYAEHLKVPDGELLQRAYLGAFFRGYDFVKRDDAAVGFLVGVQIVQDWIRVPSRDEHRSFLQTLRLAGLAQTARRMFPQLTRV